MAPAMKRTPTRGRANVFRQVFRGERYDAFSNDDLHDALSPLPELQGLQNRVPGQC